MTIHQPLVADKPVLQHPWVYLEGEFVQQAQAKIAITTQAFNYGTGVFEGIRAYASADGQSLQVFRLDDHIERLLNSAALLWLNDLPSPQEIKQLVITLLKKNEARSDCYIRPIVFKQALLPGAGFGVKLSGVSSGFSINSLNMGSYVKPEGVHCTISSWRRIADSAVPARAKITGSYVNSALAMEAAQRAGYDEAILLNQHGNLAESTTSNIFMIKNGKLITPPLSAHILEGITRDSVIRLVQRYLDLPVIERDISPSELLSADECFLSGTGVEIVPIRAIDHHPLRSAEQNSLTHAIRNLYMQAVRGENKDVASWLVAVN